METTRIFVRDPAYFGDRARGLLEILPDGAPAALRQVRTWLPGFAAASDEDIRAANLTLRDTQLVYARQHGFESWPALLTYVSALDSYPAGEPFLLAFEATKRGDWEQVTAVLRAHPDIATARGTNGNTLLNLACSLAPSAAPDQVHDASPGSSARLAAVALLLDASADANQENERGWTPLHQAGYRNDPEMAAMLLRAGAANALQMSAHGDGGTPLAVALFWGHRQAADTIAAHGVFPPNLRIAAALGHIDLARRQFLPDSSLAGSAHSGRAFYRPHSGFPRWRPSDARQEILDEALSWAARSGRVEVMPLLLQQGAHIDADHYRGTALVWAAANGRINAATWLLDHGASIDALGTFGGLSHGNGVTALHLAAQNDRADMVELLLARGADRNICDALYNGTASGWAQHAGAKRTTRLLQE